MLTCYYKYTFEILRRGFSLCMYVLEINWLFDKFQHTHICQSITIWDYLCCLEILTKSLVLSLKMHFVDSTSTKVPETGSKFQFILWQMEIRSADTMLSFYLQKWPPPRILTIDKPCREKWSFGEIQSAKLHLSATFHE